RRADLLSSRYRWVSSSDLQTTPKKRWRRSAGRDFALRRVLGRAAQTRSPRTGKIFSPGAFPPRRAITTWSKILLNLVTDCRCRPPVPCDPLERRHELDRRGLGQGHPRSDGRSVICLLPTPAESTQPSRCVG